MKEYAEKVYEVYDLTGYPFTLNDNELEKSIKSLNSILKKAVYSTSDPKSYKYNFIGQNIHMTKKDAFTLIELGYLELNGRSSIRLSKIAVFFSAIDVLFAVLSYFNFQNRGV